MRLSLFGHIVTPVRVCLAFPVFLQLFSTVKACQNLSYFSPWSDKKEQTIENINGRLFNRISRNFAINESKDASYLFEISRPTYMMLKQELKRDTASDYSS